MNARFITDLSHRSSSNQYQSNEKRVALNIANDQQAYYERKNAKIKSIIQNVINELNSPDELTEDKKEQLKQTLKTANEYLDVDWYESADYRWLSRCR